MTVTARQLTMQQIADRLGVSRMTVSTVLNHRVSHRPVTAATAQRVRDYLDQIGYVRSIHAVRLQRSRRTVVGILHSGHLEAQHLVEAVNGLTDRLGRDEPDNVELKVAPLDRTAQALRDLRARGATQLVWILNTSAGQRLHEQGEALELIRKYRGIIFNHPFIDPRLDRNLQRSGVGLVGYDRVGGFTAIGRMLVELGHRRVCTPDVSPLAAGSVQNSPLLRGLSASGLELVDAGYTHPEGGRFDPPAIAAAVRGRMRDRAVTALCFTDDQRAAAVMFALEAMSVHVPEDVSITGMDGLAWCAFLPKPVTTLAVPTDKAMDAVLAMIENRRAPRRVLIPLRLLERATHGPAANGNRSRV